MKAMTAKAFFLSLCAAASACKTTAGSKGSALRADDLTATTGVPSGNPDYLTVYIYPSTWGFSWDSPSTLVGWLVANAGLGTMLSPHNIGHSDVELFCKGVNHGGTETHFFTGQTGGFEMGDAIKAGEGLGVLTYSYAGKLYDNDHVQAGIQAAAKSSSTTDPFHKLGFITVKINPDTCDRLLTYYKEYNERNYFQQYGSRNRPRYGEGAGCTAFGVSFLDVAGVLTPEMTSYWKTTVRVPPNLVGKPTVGENRIDDFVGNGAKVSIKSLLSLVNPHTKWPTSDAPGVDVDLNDPDKMFDWISQRVTYAINNPQVSEWTEFHNGNYRGITLDRTAAPTPTEPIWMGPAADGYVYTKN